MIPLIGITCGENELNYFARRCFINVLEAVGGAPVLLPSVQRTVLREKYLDFLDGLILTGGVDMNPLLFGEEPLPGMGEITPGRDDFEMMLTKEFFAAGKPILGICRGCQVLNLSLGGSIYQDITSQITPCIKHDQKAPVSCPTHSIQLVSETKLSLILMQQHLWVNSFHHQSVKTPAPGFFVAASAPDGVIEAIEAKDHPFALGVQWHPECNWQQDLGSYRLFKTFIQHALK